MNKETMKGPIIRRKIKDSVFTALFSERKYLKQLCRVLKPDVTEKELETLSIVTLENALVYGLYNDLGFMIGDYILFLVEAQSTWSVNIVIRVAMYYFETIRQYVAENNINIYGKKIKLPKPVFYVVYTGKEKHRETEYISLAEEYFDGDDSVMDVKVKVIHSCGEGNILDQYIEFTKICDEQVKLHGRTNKAIKEIIRICVEKDILKEFLISREKEVIDMMTTLFDEETIMKAVLEEKDRERAEARAEGERLGRAEGERLGRAEGEKIGEKRGRAEGEKLGRAEGEKIGLAEGEENSRLLILGHMVKNGGYTIEEALKVTGIPEDRWKIYIQMFK